MVRKWKRKIWNIFDCVWRVWGLIDWRYCGFLRPFGVCIYRGTCMWESMKETRKLLPGEVSFVIFDLEEKETKAVDLARWKVKDAKKNRKIIEMAS